MRERNLGFAALCLTTFVGSFIVLQFLVGPWILGELEKLSHEMPYKYVPIGDRYEATEPEWSVAEMRQRITVYAVGLSGLIALTVTGGTMLVMLIVGKTRSGGESNKRA